jgi:hypothetical protein
MDQALLDVARITGLPFVPRGTRMIASCRIDGTPHSRVDKTSAKMYKGFVMIEEQGGEILSLRRWIETYGDGNIQKLPRVEHVEAKGPERIFVNPIHWESTIPSNYDGNLFRFLSGIFGSNKTRDAFLRYNIGEDGYQKTIFWYMNELRGVCHDAIVLYENTGKRRKGNAGYRKFKVDDGYSGRCVFGAHLLNGWTGEVCVVESEKTAVIMSMVDSDRLWVATGGSNKVSLIREEWKLFPDYDMAGSFWECIGCKDKTGCIIVRNEGKREKDWGCTKGNLNLIKWWKGLNINDGEDVGDFILKKYAK